MSEGGQSRILVVEDDPEIQYLLGVILEEENREIFIVGSGAEATEVLAREAIDLVVLDLILPDMDGRTLLTSLREAPETASMPVFVVSARGGAEIRQDCYALGADYFTEKPFDPEELAKDVSACLQRSAGRERATLVDPVTGLMNRAGIFAECAAAASAYGVALIQLDGFLSVSEKWGWESAEGVLRLVAEVIEKAVGDDARAGRIGGGEFVLYVPEPSDSFATRMAEKVLEAIRDLPIDDPEGETIRLTASIGVVIVDSGTALDAALEGARRRLFRARESGRNRVVSKDEDFDFVNKRVLVAEDDEISATILVHRLEKDGLDVVRYKNGRDAYEGALKETPALVILDVKMPGMDGFEVLERLRRTPSYANVPIILLTSMGSEADVVRGFQLGVDDYVLKPFSPVELSARVLRLLRRGRSPSAV